MTCDACGEKPKKMNEGFPKAVVEINNPETLVLLRKVVIPASMGDETAFPPAIGKYFNVLLHYEASGSNYLYSSDGIPTEIGANIPPEVLDRIKTLEDDYDDLAEDYEQLQSQVGDVSEALSAETSARENADIGLQGQIDAITSSSDVKDIVGTYTELQNYDTSTLGNDDIIKVLQDSTHNNAMSYYRWVITDHVGAWVYVGGEGPYYTKSEADALLNDKQNTEDNSLDTTRKTIVGAINEVNSIAKGANQALSFANYSAMVTEFNSLAGNEYNIGQNIMVVTLEVPDLWISGIESTSSTYTYTTDEAFTTAMATNGYVQVGYYKLSALETQKVDLTDYVKNTDYASLNTGGVVKVNPSYGINTASTGTLVGVTKDYSTYNSGSELTIIDKGTLENVITGKGLITSSSDITGNASTSTTLKAFNYSRNGTNNTWAKVATTSLVKTWEEKHAYLFVKGTHSTNFNQNGIISIDAVGNAIKSKVKLYSAQFISASTDLDVENFYIEYQDGDENTDATINFWVRITTSTYATWQFEILQNTGWTIESANTSVTTLPTQNFTGKFSELNNKTLNDKDGNDITTTYVKNTEIDRIKATLPTTTGSGEEVTLEKTIELDFAKPPLPRGNSEQEGEPSPDNEVPITNVTGNVEVTISNENNTESKTLPVSLGNIELCKIGDYQDYLYKNNGKWYKHNAIKKLVLNGTEGWSVSSNVFYLTSISDYINSSGKICLSDKYTAINNTNVGTSAITQNNSICFFSTNTNPRLYIRDERFNNVDAFKAELSKNNVKVYYPIVTPTDTEITDTTLISQLEEISKTLSYQGQTNITSNTIALFDVEAYQSTKLILEDLENKYSRSEIKTGTWIDNKPVYRRIFTIDLGAAPNIAQAHSLTNLDKFWVNQSASFVISSSESLPSTWYYSDTDWARTWLTNTNIRFRSPVDLTNRVLYVTVEYTKTTD